MTITQQQTPALITLSTNADSLKDRNLEFKSSEISVAVLLSDLENLVETPVFYAYRYGMIYDPDNDFKPNIVPNHKIKGQLVEDYWSQKSLAKLEYAKRLEVERNKKGEMKEGGNVEELEQLKLLAKSQEYRINELLNSKEDTQTKEMQELKELLQAKTKEIEALKKGENNEIRHEKFDKIVKLLKKKKAVYLYGDAGTGKSNLAEQIAKYLKLDFYPMSTITQEFKFTGYQDGNGIYHSTNFYKAVKNGGLFFIDEMDSCSSDVLVGLNACLANGYFDFPHETIEAHKDFVVISAGNTIGRGATVDYAGRQALDLSTLDRFLALKIDYDARIDLAVAKNDQTLVEFAHALRKASKETEITVLMSYRSIATIAELMEDKDFDLVELMEWSVIKGMPQDDINMLARNMTIDSTNKYYKAFKKAVA
jgi:MoxR-like ATPase